MSGHTGEIAGVSASLAWAVSSLVFSRARAPAGALNLFKNSVAAALFLATLGASAAWRGVPVLTATPDAVGWLVASAVIGIVLGDTAYFRSLQILGARRALMLATLAPPLVAALGWPILGESLSSSYLAGMAATLAGVVWVVRDPGLVADGAGHYPGSAAAGAAYGALGALCQALGVVMSKLGMKSVEPLEASFIRLGAAAAAGLVIASLLGRLGVWRRSLFAPGVPPRLCGAAACGTYLGIWLSLTATKHAPAAVASTLTALSPIFVLPLARLFLGFRITLRSAAGAALAAAGVALLF